MLLLHGGSSLCGYSKALHSTSYSKAQQNTISLLPLTTSSRPAVTRKVLAGSTGGCRHTLSAPVKELGWVCGSGMDSAHRLTLVQKFVQLTEVLGVIRFAGGSTVHILAQNQVSTSPGRKKTLESQNRVHVQALLNPPAFAMIVATPSRSGWRFPKLGGAISMVLMIRRESCYLPIRGPLSS